MIFKYIYFFKVKNKFIKGLNYLRRIKVENKNIGVHE